MQKFDECEIYYPGKGGTNNDWHSAKIIAVFHYDGYPLKRVFVKLDVDDSILFIDLELSSPELIVTHFDTNNDKK